MGERLSDSSCRMITLPDEMIDEGLKSHLWKWIVDTWVEKEFNSDGMHVAAVFPPVYR